MNHIFTDGACQSNGRKGAKAAYAVVLWSQEGTHVEIAEHVPQTEQQTNQRAELRGMLRAFEELQKQDSRIPTTIWTDSEYVRKCVTEWGPQWKAYGWKRKANPKKQLEHLDLLKPMIDYYELNQHRIRIQHVQAHTGKQEFPWSGNELSDMLETRKLTL